jgi:hypothetical protein
MRARQASATGCGMGMIPPSFAERGLESERSVGPARELELEPAAAPTSCRVWPRMSAKLSPTLRRLVAVALAEGGDLGRMRKVLSLPASLLRRQLWYVRAAGYGRLAHLFDPTAMGRPQESCVLVQLKDYTRETMDELEARFQTDDAVTCAAAIAGVYDYQLSAFHADLQASQQWRRELEASREVARVRMYPLRRVSGDTLPGLVLRHGRPMAKPRRRQAIPREPSALGV